MPAIGNASSFRATNVPTPKVAPAKTAPPPARTVVPDARPHGTGVLPTVAHTNYVRPNQSIGQSNSGRPAGGPPHPGMSSFIAKIARGPQSASPSPSGRLVRLVAAMTRGAVADPFAPIAANGPVMTTPLRQMMVQGQFNQDYQTLSKLGLLPSDAQQPPLVFPSKGAGAEGGLSYEVGAGGRGTINLSPMTVYAATSPGSGLHTWAESTLVHELAHALQRPSVQKNVVLREGGAQAYADAVVPKLFGPLLTNDTNYASYVNAVRRRGPSYFMQQQFGPR